MDENSLHLRLGRRRIRAAAGSALAVAALAVAAVAVAAVAADVPAAHGAPSGQREVANSAAHAPMMYVATSADTVVPVDLRTEKALAPISLPKTMPVCMAVTRNGKTIYVAGFDGDITPVSTATRTAGQPIVIDGHPGQIVLAPSGRSGYVVGDGGGYIPVNLVTRTTGKPVKDRAIGRLVLAPGGKTAYGLNAGAWTTVIPVNLATNRVLRPHTFQRLILQFTVTPSGKSAWVFLGGTANTVELVRVNLTTWAVSAPIKLPDGTQQVAFGPRDATAYAFGTNQVTPVDLAKRALGTRIKLPISPRAWPDGFALAPDGRTAMVYNFVRNRGVEIVPVNLARGIALSPVYLGYKLWVPQHVTFTPDSKTAYVSIVDDDLGELQLGKLIPVSAATGTRVGQPINLGGQPLQILVTR